MTTARSQLSRPAKQTSEDAVRRSEGPERRSLWRAAMVRQETSLVLVCLVVGAIATARSHLFLTHDNLIEILRDSVIYFVTGCGAALLIIGGGLDFSAGAVFTLGALITSKLLVASVGWPIAIVLGLALCCVVGAVNHLIITFWHVPPIIATLGTFYALSGIDNKVTGGNDVVPLPNSFQHLTQGSIAGVPNDVIVAVAVGLGTWFLLDRTRFGVNIRALGGNRNAAVGNGLRTRRLDIALYVIAAATAGLAGIIYSSRVGAGQVSAGGTSITLTVITGVLIGGVSLLGGMGTIQGVAIGAVLLSLINNALVLTQIPPEYNSIVIGTILVCAVALDHLRRERIYRKR